MKEENLDTVVLKKMDMPEKQEPDLKKWEEFLFRLKNPTNEVNIGLVGKYAELKDAYKSISEAFNHASSVHQCKVNVKMIHAEGIEENNVEDKLKGLNGIVVAPGFGERGIEGKITTIKYAREQKIPFLGICLGMQCAVVEFARNVLNFKDAHSTEMNPHTTHPVIFIMKEQENISSKGGTMRLGAYPCDVKEGTKAMDVYHSNNISERHRHRYEFNNKYIQDFIKAGMIPSGINTKDDLVEIMEIPSHPWFVGVQFHPEYKSTVSNPHPLFVAFVKAAIETKLKK